MKPRNDVIQIDGSLGGEVTRMELDNNALAHLMGVLTNLYSDTELAVIREYSTNALDSHIFAGQDRPIEVFTPTSMTNEFVVKDYGLGLSKDELQNVYGSYGASTKRGSDDVAGCLGLGSKSALAYTSAFTVIGVKDGMRTTAVIALGEDGVGRIEVVDESETDEHNGVTVRVPANYSGEFTDSVFKFFSYWDKGTVLVDGKPPVHFSDRMTQIDDSVWFGQKTYNEDQITVVMGGVSYGLDDYNYTNKLRNRSVVVMADMGDVDFVPSREALNLTTRTRDYIRTLVQYVVTEADRILQAKMDSATSRREVVEMAKNLWARDHYDTITWRGIDHQLYPYVNHFQYSLAGRKCKTGDRLHIASLYEDNVAILVGKPYSHLSGLQRDKLAQFVEDNNLGITHVYYFSGKAPYMAREAKVIKFSEVNEVVPRNRTKSTYKKPDGQKVTWRTWSWDANRERVVYEDALVDPNKTIVYIAGAHSWQGRMTGIMEEYKDPNVVLVKIVGNRLNTFKRAYPNALRESEYIKQLSDALDGFVPDEDWEVSTINRHDIAVLVGETDDPMIDDIWDRMQKSKVTEYERRLRVLGMSGMVEDKKPTNNYLDENYPLINAYYPKESIEYVNAMYAARNGKDN